MKKITKLELFICVITLCIMASIFVPKFLDKQGRATELRIQQGLDTLFSALRNYTNDYNAKLPEHIVERKFIDYSNYLQIAPTYKDQFSFLVTGGYLSNPEYQLALDQIEISRDYLNVFIFIHKDRQTYLPKQNLQNYVTNIEIAVLNPNRILPNGEKPFHLYSLSTLLAEHGTNTGPGLNTINPSGYFHITNGVNSFGVVYQNLSGIRSSNY